MANGAYANNAPDVKRLSWHLVEISLLEQQIASRNSGRATL